MTPSCLALNLGLSFAALAAFCLSLNRHHGEILRSKPGKGRVIALRALGWAGIGLSFLAAVRTEGWAFAPVQWLGAITGAGVLLVLLLSYRPRLVCPAAGVSLALAAAGALLA